MAAHVGRILTLLRRAADVPHTGDGCQCWRCVSHRLTLDTANQQTTRNAEYAVHLEAVRRRVRRRLRAVSAAEILAEDVES